MKLYPYFFDERYRITTIDPNHFIGDTYNLYIFTKPSSTLIEKLGFTNEEWKKLITKHNGRIEYLFEPLFLTKEDVKNFIAELEPHLIMSTLMGG